MGTLSTCACPFVPRHSTCGRDDGMWKCDKPGMVATKQEVSVECPWQTGTGTPSQARASVLDPD